MYRLFSRTLKFFCFAMFAGFLSGCYEATQPLIQKGEYVDLAGGYSCTSKIDGRVSSYTFTEQKGGWIPFFHDYTYQDGHAEAMTFKSLHDGLYLVQVKAERDPVFKFFFAKFLPPGIVLYAPNLLQQSALLDSWLKEAGARVNSSNPDHIRLVGDTERSLAFLAKHDLSALTIIAECARG